MNDLIGYDEIIENSMRSVICKVLKKVEKEGLKGAHYFVISFTTNHFGVVISEKLKQKFPSEMTIIVQHQFRALNVFENAFKISLNFSGIPETLSIPYNAITSFTDPSVNFALKFNTVNDPEIPETTENISQNNITSENSAKVISLDEFRKNHNNN